jgi:hypothetical protein
VLTPPRVRRLKDFASKGGIQNLLLRTLKGVQSDAEFDKQIKVVMDDNDKARLSISRSPAAF